MLTHRRATFLCDFDAQNHYLNGNIKPPQNQDKTLDICCFISASLCQYRSWDRDNAILRVGFSGFRCEIAGVVFQNVLRISGRFTLSLLIVFQVVSGLRLVCGIGLPGYVGYGEISL